MEKHFPDKVALVTGAGSGIGQATAILYAAHGAKVIVSDINEHNGHHTAAMIHEKGGKATFVKTDVSSAAECEHLVRKTVETYGRIDIACNNAGIMGEANGLAKLSIEGWDKAIATNLSGVFYCLKYELHTMLEQGTGGAIVNTTSVMGKVGFAAMGAYVAAKHGIVGLTETAAIEYAAKGIRVNSVAPGFIDTAFLGHVRERMKQGIALMHPAGRLGKPEEIAELIIWLSSDKAAYANGGFYPIDGGYLAR